MISEEQVRVRNLEQELVSLAERTVVRLPANYDAVYRLAIAELEVHVATRETSASRDAIRPLVEAVMVHQGDSRGGRFVASNSTAMHVGIHGSGRFGEGGDQKRRKPPALSR